ncbi:MAG TPA: CDP-alcohol phosphatidyltransferase family protein [Geminicoccaceae bacterium]|nr:CDP-alcohol phosphatidyltransferase family protein [Geminicoccus sp.]HMU49347.1 CDP-alcohol phosphatidyltransferase family protein [Geminicoccaceae bacterium]
MAVASSGRPGRDRGAGAGSHAAPLSLPQSIANLLTLARLACTVPLVLLLTQGQAVAAFWLFVVAALSDGVDGYIAKRFNGCSALGAVLDPAADKLLLASVFCALALVGAVPLWLVALIIGRDLLIVGGAALLRWRVGGFRIEPLIIGKVCTFVQLLFAGFLLGQLAGIADVGWVLAPLQMAVAAITLVSALAYVTAGLRLVPQRAG